MGLPSVCSPRSAFRAAITDGVDGFLADGVAEWTEALDRLVRDESLRRDMGARAFSRATEVTAIRPLRIHKCCRCCADLSESVPAFAYWQ